MGWWFWGGIHRLTKQKDMAALQGSSLGNDAQSVTERDTMYIQQKKIAENRGKGKKNGKRANLMALYVNECFNLAPNVQ